MSTLLVLPVVLPIVGAAVSILVGRARVAQRVIGTTILASVTVISIVLAIAVDRDGPLAVQAGGWPAPVGITLVADRFSAIMVVIGSVVVLAVFLYAIGQPGPERNHVGFQSVYLVLSAGVAASFLAGDLFNLFVAFEMMLTSSYVLITLGGRRDQVRSGMTYVVISLIASALFLVAIAFIYSATGTVNMADLSEKMAVLPVGLLSALSVLLLVVFGIKAAIFPLFFWLPDSYPTAPSPVTAVFAGLLTKVGVYAIFRTQTLLFPSDSRPATLLLVLAGLTMVVGVLGAIAQGDVKRILSFHIVSQIGYMIMGLGLFTLAGIAGAILYIVHHIVVKTSLFLTGGLIEHVGGSSRLSRVGGMVGTAPLLAALFILPALSLAGIPPFSGFLAKLALVEAGVSSTAYVIVGVSLAVSLLTLFSMMKIWGGVFWNPPEVVAGEEPASGKPAPALMIVPTVALVAVSLAIAVAAGPLYALTERAATDLLDPVGYVQAVLGGAPTGSATP